MVKVAIALPTIRNYRSRYMMVRELSRLCDDTLLLSNEPVPDFALPQRGLSVVSPSLQLNKPFFNMLIVAAIIRNSWRFDVFHDFFYNMIPLFLTSSSLGMKTKRVVSLYASNIDWICEPRIRNYSDARYNRLRLINYVLERVELPMADGVIVVSPHMKSSLVKHLDLDSRSIEVIPSEVDTDFFRPAESSPAELKSKIENPKILFVGNIFRLKGVFELVEAFAILKGNYPRAELQMVGRINEFDEAPLKSRIHQLSLTESVSFLGYVGQEELVRLYSDANVFVFPTRFEGSPRVVKEACACGCPVVASRHPGIMSIDPEGRFITYVDPMNPESIADGIMNVFKSCEARRRRSSLSREEMISRYSPSIIAAKIHSFYEDLLSDE